MLCYAEGFCGVFCGGASFDSAVAEWAWGLYYEAGLGG